MVATEISDILFGTPTPVAVNVNMGVLKEDHDNIINGRIRVVAGVVGCTNPRIKQDWAHVELVKTLIKNDVLVPQTGRSQISLAKEGL